MRLLKGHHHSNHDQEEKEEGEEDCNIYMFKRSIYNSTQEEQELIKQGYILHISPKRKRGEKEEEVQLTTQPCLNRKNILQEDGLYMERTNSWHNRFQKTVADMKRRRGELPWSSIVLIVHYHL